MKPLYIYEHIKADITTYVIVNKSKDLFSNLVMFNDYLNQHSLEFMYFRKGGKENVICFGLSEELFSMYHNDKDKLKVISNTFLDFRKLTYAEVVKLIILEATSEFDIFIKDLINKIILYWDDWN